MANINKAVFSGNVIADPEYKQVGDGPEPLSITEFRVAVNDPGKRNDNGGYDDGYASYLDCKAFGKFSELLARKLQKADRVSVVARIKQERWETQEGNRSKVVFIVETLDSDALFREGGDLPEAAQQTTAAAAPAPADDDIPF